jgi:cyclic beta-1,2-glucan synthetase
MLDNLRRTLGPPGTLLALGAGWLLPPIPAARWTVCILLMIAVPFLLPVVSGILPRRLGISKRSHLLALGADLGLGLSQMGFHLAFLAHQAW